MPLLRYSWLGFRLNYLPHGIICRNLTLHSALGYAILTLKSSLDTNTCGSKKIPQQLTEYVTNWYSCYYGLCCRAGDQILVSSEASAETAFPRALWRVRVLVLVGRVDGGMPWGRQFRLKLSRGA